MAKNRVLLQVPKMLFVHFPSFTLSLVILTASLQTSACAAVIFQEMCIQRGRHGRAER